MVGPSREADVIIVGAGISGASLFYLLSRFSPLERVLLLEQREQPGQGTSHFSRNAQTLHQGDIESNYSLEKSEEVRDAAALLARYCEHKSDALQPMSRLLLAEGPQEIEWLKQRFNRIRKLYPNLEWFDAAAIADIEPNVVLDRQSDIAAIGEDYSPAAMDFGAIAHHFVNDAVQMAEQTNRHFELRPGVHVESIEEKDGGFVLNSNKGIWRAKAIVVSAGNRTLQLMKQYGVGDQYLGITMAGRFYRSHLGLNGKVYTWQNSSVPFAAIHGDRDFHSEETRFGPTAHFMPRFEHDIEGTTRDYLKTFSSPSAWYQALSELLSRRDIRQHVLSNLKPLVPGVGKDFMAKHIRKIIPSITAQHLTKEQGGLRTQLYDLEAKKLILGEVKINPGNGLIFNVTPSPGASACLANAWLDLTSLGFWLGFEANVARLDEVEFS